MSKVKIIPQDNLNNKVDIIEIENSIICGDAIEVLKKLPDESIDCIITDPPYKVSQKGKQIVRTYAHYNWKRKTNIRLDFGEWDRYWKTDEDYFIWTEYWFKECARVLKPGAWIYIFFDKFRTGLFDLWLAPKYGLKSKTIYVYVKSNPVPNYHKANWNSGTEHIWVGCKGKGKLKNFLYQKYMMNYFIYPNASVWKKTKHPTEKPEKLIERLVLVNSNEGEIILDPFFGSGTTGVVAKRLGRKFIGIEMEESYCRMAKERIDQTEVELFK